MSLPHADKNMEIQRIDTSAVACYFNLVRQVKQTPDSCLLLLLLTAAKGTRDKTRRTPKTVHLWILVLPLPLITMLLVVLTHHSLLCPMLYYCYVSIYFIANDVVVNDSKILLALSCIILALVFPPLQFIVLLNCRTVYQAKVSWFTLLWRDFMIYFILLKCSGAHLATNYERCYTNKGCNCHLWLK